MNKTHPFFFGPLFVAGKTKECVNLTCRNYQKRNYAGRVWLYSLPGSTYGLVVLAWIGWQHEHERRQVGHGRLYPDPALGLPADFNQVSENGTVTCMVTVTAHNLRL
jgi:hypothetical protein